VVIDQQQIAGAVAVLGKAGEMDLAHRIQRQGAEIGRRIPMMVHAGDMDIVHIQQQSAAGAAHHRRDEIRFGQGRGREFDIGGRVFQQQAPLQALLHLVDMRANPLERTLVIGNGQEIIEKSAAVATPGQMFGERLRLIARQQPRQAVQMPAIQRRRAAERQPHPMHRQRIARADAGQGVMEGSALDEVILGVDLKKTDVGLGFQHLPEMRGFQPQPGTHRQARIQGGSRPRNRLALGRQGHRGRPLILGARLVQPFFATKGFN
jgi:hypothetical protein